MGATVSYLKYSLYLGNVSGNFSTNDKKNRTRLNRCVYDFSVDYRAVNTRNIIDIHKDLKKKHDIK